jgi:hypothetical protein
VFSIGPPANGQFLWNVAACHVIYIGKSRSGVEMASSSQDEKAIFFRGLDELDEFALESDHKETFDPTTNGEHLYSPHKESSKPLFSQTKADSHARLTRVSRPTRSGSLVGPSKLKMSSIISSRKSGFGKVLMKHAKKQNGKKSLQLQPEDAQIFQGLTFCEYTMSDFPSLDCLTKARFLAQQ